MDDRRDRSRSGLGEASLGSAEKVGSSPRPNSRHPDSSKRNLLRLAVLAGAGGVLAVLLSRSLAGNVSNLSSQSTQSQVQTTSQVVLPVSSSGHSSIKVKVRFFQMSQIIPASEEYFAVPSPAQYSDLLGAVLSRYPKIGAMIPTMVALVDGFPAKAATPLNDGDEVDFIPSLAGG